MTQELGQLKKIKVGKLWNNEQYDFTPWLAQDENIAKLGKAVGLELEVENIEVAVGPYSADILAKDGSNRYVVIENQFGKTNHDHLGKLITYGSALNASAIIWLAEEFTDEHQRALDWLNDHTDEDFSLYGVIVELLQIDESRPAVQFNVVSRPAETIRKAAIKKASGELSETKTLQLEFWTEFRKRLLAAKVVASTQTARPQYWFDVSLGRSGIFLSNIANTYENRIGVRVYISNTIADIALPQLEMDRDAIEAEIGEKLEWDPNPNTRDKIIALRRNADLRKRNEWPDYLDWMVDRVRRFRKVFSPRVKKLDLSKVPSQEDDEEHMESQQVSNS